MHAKRTALATIAGLLALFAALAYFAVASKSPTYDEPLHALGAWQHLHTRDFRVNPEDPPLWHYWAALPNGPGAIRADISSDLFTEVSYNITSQWQYTVETLFQTEGNDGDTFILRSRVMMLIVGVALGVAIACWAWQLAGPIAAVVAAGFFALDPNFLAHGPLVKNDVSLSLITLGLAWAIWRAGRKLTPWNATAICLCCAAALTTKFSGLLLGPIAAAMLVIRALRGDEWDVLGQTIRSRLGRVGVAAALCAAAGIVSYIGIWAAYGFRYNPSPDPKIRLNTDVLLKFAAVSEFTAKHNRVPTTQEREGWTPGSVPRAILWLDEKHVLPQAWLFGLLYTWQSALARATFLLGDYSFTGWWYYFPLTMLYKSSLTLLASLALAAAIAVNFFKHRALAAPGLYWRWSAICLALPPTLYLIAAMRSNLNLGLRHILPVYPFLYIAIGLAAARVWTLRPTVAKRATVVIALAMLIETFAAFPNYIAFFNAAAGGSRGGLRLLGDSNLDWGQDLKLLAEWRQRNPQGALHMIYFGTADPWAYGINDYINFPGGYKFGPAYEISSKPGVLAVSATMLQGVYADPRFRAIYSTLRKLTPFEVLGGTIYLYRWPLTELPE